MQDNETPQTLESRAERNVERKIGFLIHLAVYIGVNSLLVSLNAMQHIGVPWSAGPLIGWGIGLFFHGLAVFVRTTGATWKQRMIEREIERQRARRTS